MWLLPRLLYTLPLTTTASYYSCAGYVWKSDNPCKGKSLNCFEGVFYYLGSYRNITDQGVEKTCMAACTDQLFTTTVSSSRYPGQESYNHRPAFCHVVRYTG